MRDELFAVSRYLHDTQPDGGSLAFGVLIAVIALAVFRFLNP